MKKEETQGFLHHALNTLLCSTSDLVFFKDINLVYRGASQSFANLVGRESGDQLVGKDDYAIFPPELAHSYIQIDRGVLESGQPVVGMVEPLPDKEGKAHYSVTSKYCIRDDEGVIIGLFGIARDVTAKMELEEERELRGQSSPLFNSSLEADLTENHLIRAENSTYSSALNFSDETPFDVAMTQMASTLIHPEHREEFLHLFDQKTLLSHCDTNHRLLTYVKVGTGYRWTELTSRVYHSKVSRTLRIIIYFKDLDVEVRQSQLLTEKAETDPLTGLLNRKSLLQKIDDCITSYGAKQTHALLFVDLDSFKQVNDNLGHLYGDKVLIQAATSLRSLFRQEDLVGRIGGDEFMILMKNVPSEKEVRNKVTEILNAPSFSNMFENEHLAVTFSAGVTIYRGDGKDLETLYDEADKAMYKAKEHGRNRITFYD